MFYQLWNHGGWATAWLPSNKDTGGPCFMRNNILFLSTEWMNLNKLDLTLRLTVIKGYTNTTIDLILLAGVFVVFFKLKPPPIFGNYFLPRQGQTDIPKHKLEYLEGLRRLTTDHMLIWIFRDTPINKNKYKYKVKIRMAMRAQA